MSWFRNGSPQFIAAPPPRLQNHMLFTLFLSAALFLHRWKEESWRHNRSWAERRIGHLKQQWDKKVNSNSININKSIKKENSETQSGYSHSTQAALSGQD